VTDHSVCNLESKPRLSSYDPSFIIKAVKEDVNCTETSEVRVESSVVFVAGQPNLFHQKRFLLSVRSAAKPSSEGKGNSNNGVIVSLMRSPAGMSGWGMGGGALVSALNNDTDRNKGQSQRVAVLR
jgi:hypothetical protein